ncbi:MAG: hypothetical protein AB7U71_05840 [Comamonas sp.]
MVKALTFFVWWLSTVLVVLLWDCRTGCNLTALNLLMRLSSALLGVSTVALLVWAFKRPTASAQAIRDRGLISKAEIEAHERRL